MVYYLYLFRNVIRQRETEMIIDCRKKNREKDLGTRWAKFIFCLCPTRWRSPRQFNHTENCVHKMEKYLNTYFYSALSAVVSYFPAVERKSVLWIGLLSIRAFWVRNEVLDTCYSHRKSMGDVFQNLRPDSMDTCRGRKLEFYRRTCLKICDLNEFGIYFQVFFTRKWTKNTWNPGFGDWWLEWVIFLTPTVT